MTRRRLTETHRRPRVPGPRAACAAARGALGALAALLAFAARGAAEPRPLQASVVWARADRVYIAAADSLPLAAGDLVTLQRGRKTVAAGEVTQVLARDLAAARLTSGPLARVSKLDKIRVLAERPPLAALPLLRIGGPGRGRSSLLFDCARPVAHSPLPDDAYRTDSLAENAYRMVRATGGAGGAPWPDTILVRLFGEAADEEIALERGELDLAIFRPGEASSRLRADPRWPGAVSAPAPRGVLAAIAASDGSADAVAALSPDSGPLAALDDELFRGDLAPWRAADPASHAATPPAQPPRFVVDPSCPGRLAIERFLERAAPAAGSRPEPPVVRLCCFPVEPGERALESLARGVAGHVRGGPYPPEMRARADTLALEAGRLATDPAAAERLRRYLRDSLHVALLFGVRDALAFDPRLGPYLSALGLDALAGIVGCAAAERAP